MKKHLLMAVFTAFTLFTQAQNITLLGHLSYNVTTSGVWHYVDSVGNEYALVGADNRVSIVDVTIPANPVEVASIPALPGQNSKWRELKTFGKYAYSVSEGGGGVIIINLSSLPDVSGIVSKHWYGDGAISGLLGKAHTVGATDGYLYVFGSKIGVGGALIANLADPWNPTYVGQYNQAYIHDGFVRGDTLWAGEIYAGRFSVIDISDKTNPVLITNQQTPGNFCHNTWLSDNGKYLFTTDEKFGASLGSFDVSSMSNIQLKTTYRCDSIPTEEVHNVRVLNDFLINPSYGSHLTIVDASRPTNLVEIANASARWNGSQSFLCWDASPYLPSGNIIATDVNGGLFIYQPVYTRASFLEGIVTDSLTQSTLNGVKVEIMTTNKVTNTDLIGIYKTGIAATGIYDIRFSKVGYVTKIYFGVSLASGLLTTINAELVPFSTTGQVTDQLSLLAIPNAQVNFSNGVNSYFVTCDANGFFSIGNLIYDSSYMVSAGKWGYVTECVTQLLDGTSPVNFQLQTGYMDDFAINNSWIANSTCTTGKWVYGVPKGTMYGASNANPAADITGDCSNICMMTGNGGGSSTADDVDDGFTSLTSPVFDLTSYNNPYINYSRWFFINPNVIAAFSDTFFISVNNGITTVTLEFATLNSIGNGTWVDKSFKVSDYITPTAYMTLIAFAEDKPGTGNVVEAALDKFIISNSPLAITQNVFNDDLDVFPNPFSQSFTLNVNTKVLTSKSVINIVDLSGRVIFSQPLNAEKTEIRLPESTAKGIYLLRINNVEKALPPVKIIKQ